VLLSAALESVWSKDGVNLAETPTDAQQPKIAQRVVPTSLAARIKASAAEGRSRGAARVRDVREEGLGDAAAGGKGSDLAFEELAAFVKTPGKMQYGDVISVLGQNSKFLTSSKDANSCQAIKVGAGEKERDTDWAVVNPAKPHEYGGAVFSGSMVSFRDPSSGRYLAYKKWADGKAFTWEAKAARAASFRILTGTEAANDVESTSRVPIMPKGGIVKPGEMVLLLPQLEEAGSEVDKYSVYMSEGKGLSQKTDSTFVGWQFALSPRAGCVFTDVLNKETGLTTREGEKADRIGCCRWELVAKMNDGVAKAEQRRCCDRTDLKKCVASVRRIKSCSSSHKPDDNQKDVAIKEAAKLKAEKAALAAEKIAYTTKLKTEDMTTKAEGHEALVKLHRGLQRTAQKIVDARKATDGKNKARTAVMIADCKKQMAESMAAMQASSKAARAKAQGSIMKKMAQNQITERSGQLTEAEEHLAIQEADLKKWADKLAVTQSPKGKMDMQALVDETNASKKKAGAAVGVARKKLSASKLQLVTGKYTELSHMKMQQTKELNASPRRDEGGKECINYVQKRENERHAILKDEWTAEEKIAKKNRDMKEKETVSAVEARGEEAKRRGIYEKAFQSSVKERGAASAAVAAYQKVSTGGKCCATLLVSTKGSNPKVTKEECCSANKCSFNEAKTITTHTECSSHGALTIEGCKCHTGWGGMDCSVAVDATACFGGARANGDRPANAAACGTCYKCSKGAAVKDNTGGVVIAGADVCSQAHPSLEASHGKEHLCLSCKGGAGLIRYGDTHKALFSKGYRQAGRCQPYPRLDVAKATHVGTEAEPTNCHQVCTPSLAGGFKKGTSTSCTKVCSSWNPCPYIVIIGNNPRFYSLRAGLQLVEPLSIYSNNW